MAEETSGLTLAHHEDWDPISRLSVAAHHETEDGTDRRYARELAHHKWMFLRQRARLKTMWTPWRVVDMLLMGMLVNHRPC